MYSGSYSYYPYTFTKDKLYKAQISLASTTGRIYFELAWYWYGVIDYIYFHDYYSIENIGVFPANQVQVIWAGNYNTTTNIWTPKWGDGIKVDEEECDDKNNLNGDGCSNVCKIEQGFQWIIDNSGKSNCQKISPSNNTTTHGTSNSNTNPLPTPINNTTDGNQSGNSTNWNFNWTAPNNSSSNLKKDRNFEWLIISWEILTLLCSIVWLCLNSKFRSFNIEHLQIISLLALTNSKLWTDLENFFKMIGNSLFWYSFINPPNFLNFYQDNDQGKQIKK